MMSTFDRLKITGQKQVLHFPRTLTDSLEIHDLFLAPILLILFLHQVQLVGQCLSHDCLCVCVCVCLCVSHKNMGSAMVRLGTLTAVEHLVDSPTTAI